MNAFKYRKQFGVSVFDYWRGYRLVFHYKDKKYSVEANMKGKWLCKQIGKEQYTLFPNEDVLGLTLELKKVNHKSRKVDDFDSERMIQDGVLDSDLKEKLLILKKNQ